MSPTPLRTAVVGAGKISGAYLRTLRGRPEVTVVAVADLDPARARLAAGSVPGARAVSVAEACAAEDVDLVLNLTVPAAHAEVALAAIAGGKHVYGEKPLAATTGEAREVLTAAAAAGVRVGCAPDTVLGTGLQTARAVLDGGGIGRPVAATAFMVCPGHELWHPDPEFYYRPGGGPLLDMGPYHLTALVTLLGPVRRVTGLTARPGERRTIAAGPRAGEVFPVEVATHVTGVLEHAGGALTTLVMSFDVWQARLPHLEVYGSAGSLSVPDPNEFAGPVALHRAGGPGWEQVPVLAGHPDTGRGCGVVDLAWALADGTPHRADGELAFHVLEVMEALLASAEAGRAVEVTSSCGRPAAVPTIRTRGDLT
ncbi:Gfo/Idh/MocA family oxidoreductase [Kitasatospora sp. NPDC002227]|uniref:Gfo/Idh/MocA family protein n=1 Tax=Kitasatospora sp. NPDC002227 TaxID=3154773 RepID=UPI00331EEF74